jgi:antitoxin component HigA of HigAB toxin-antitoxin module
MSGAAGLVFLVLLLLVVSPLYGRGNKEVSVISQADALIEEKQYNRALALLSEYVKNNPDRFDQAQKRIQIILKVRDEYNVLAQRLLTVMETEPENSALLLTLSEQLIELDPERIAETQGLINNVRNLALFMFNRSRLAKILDEGSALIAERRYSEAMKVYAGGLDIYLEDFFNAGYGTEAENNVRRELESLNSGIAVVDSLIAPLRSDIAALENLQSQEPNRQNVNACNAVFNRLSGSLDRLARLRESYGNAERIFQTQLESIQEVHPGTGDRTFPAFAIRLLEGRSEDTRDGMLGVLDAVWDSAAVSAASVLTEKTAAAYTAAYNMAARQEFAGLNGRIGLFDEYAAMPQQLFDRWGSYNESAPRETIAGVQVPQDQAGEYAAFSARMRAANYYRPLGSLGTRLQSLPSMNSVAAWQNGSNAAALIAQEQDFTAGLRRMKEDARDIEADVQSDIDEYMSYQQRFGGSSTVSPLNDVQKILDNLETMMTGEEIASLGRQYTIANGMTAAQIDRREQELRQGISVLRDSRSPSLALPAFTSLEASIDGDLRALNSLIDRYEGEGEALGNPELNALYNNALTLRSRLEATRENEQRSAAEARSLSEQARGHIQAGDGFYAGAQTALNRGDFDLARSDMLQAGEQYGQALLIEDSSSVRQSRDILLPRLDAEIARLENEALIREVEASVADAKAAYYQGDFDRAEQLLTMAQNRWKSTQTVENQEIINWLNVVRGALLSRSGRTIPATAPLYPEMSQLLSEARKNYDQGVSYLGANRRNEGMMRFSNAREKTQKVKLLYPLNEDAGILELRMDRETDPAVFDENFGSRLQIARAGTQRGSWQAYADLQNLFLINPNYPNRNAIVYEAEIAMGIRMPPPNPQKIAASKSQTSEAAAIVRDNPNNELQLKRALELVNQALVNNPENSDAAQLASRIYLLLGGSLAVFDHDTEQKYQRAGELLQRNNALEAYSIAQEIARDPRYRNNSRLLDLLQRIRANL